MNELASKGQLRLSYLRWALVTVPLVLLLGLASARLANSGFENRWFAALRMPDLMPPPALFGIVWSILYILMGLALASVLHARGAKGRGLAIALFFVQLLLNLGWSPLFFAAHEVTAALYLIVTLLVLATLTTILFGRIRAGAAWLMVPYLVWLGFASGLNHDIDRLNPDAETLVAPAVRTQI
jgi:tryptophan-rich sensory protein